MNEENRPVMPLWESKEANGTRYSINENRLFYAWNWFSFHAGQRTTVFNFFLLAIGLILTAFAKCLDVKSLLLTRTTAALGIFVSLIFLLLDIRNRELTHMGEAVLRRLESEFLFKDQFLKKEYSGDPNDRVKAGFLNREGVDPEGFLEPFKHPIKHRVLMPLTHGLFLAFFIAAFIFSSSFIKDPKSPLGADIPRERKEASRYSPNLSTPSLIQPIQEIPCTHKENERINLVEINKLADSNVNLGNAIEEPNEGKGEATLKDE